jgi:hypothetical protein
VKTQNLAPEATSTLVNVGDRVRSYDFPHSRDHYIEGVVVDIKWIEGCNRYKIEVQKVVMDGAAGGDRGGPTFVYPPVNGTPNDSSLPSRKPESARTLVPAAMYR